jgi:hypothetical protein
MNTWRRGFDASARSWRPPSESSSRFTWCPQSLGPNGASPSPRTSALRGVVSRNDNEPSTAAVRVACEELRVTYFGNLDASWEPDLRRARNAFEVCLALSRKYRLLTEYTLECEHGLARSFRPNHAKLDELVPTAHWGAPKRHVPKRYASRRRSLCHEQPPELFWLANPRPGETRAGRRIPPDLRDEEQRCRAPPGSA